MRGGGHVRKTGRGAVRADQSRPRLAPDADSCRFASPIFSSFAAALRRLNLHDTQRGGFPKPEREVGPEVYRLGRTSTAATMTSPFRRWARAACASAATPPIDTLHIPTAREVMEPNPREVSRRLLARRNGEFHGVPYLNIFAAAWLQFMTHDWFGHNRDDANPHEIPLADDDDWAGTARSAR